MKIGILIFTFLLALSSYGAEVMVATPKVGSLFQMCNDIAQIEKFYGQILGIKTVGSVEEGYLDVDAGIHITFFKADYEIPVQKEWAWQPGYSGGAANISSLSIQFSEEHFGKVISALRTEKIESLKPIPEWRQNSYWGFTVKDPMGTTVELYFVPATKPNPPVFWK